MNKHILVVSLLFLAIGSDAKKKEVRNPVPEPVAEVVAGKEPLRSIARESSKGRTLTNKEQAIFLEENIEDTADDVGMIRYTITVFKDKSKYSMGDWDDTTRRAVSKFKSVTAQHNEWVDSVIDDIRGSLAKAFDHEGPRSGIHAEIKIQMSSGERPTDCRCGINCGCGVKYSGNCPCSLETAKAYPAELRVCCLDKKK